MIYDEESGLSDNPALGSETLDLPSPVDVDNGHLPALGHGRVGLERFDPQVSVEVLRISRQGPNGHGCTQKNDRREGLVHREVGGPAGRKKAGPNACTNS